MFFFFFRHCATFLYINIQKRRSRRQNFGKRPHKTLALYFFYIKAVIHWSRHIYKNVLINSSDGIFFFVFFFREASAYVTKKSFIRLGMAGEQASGGVYACVVWQATGWRWWSFHQYLHTHTHNFDNQAVRGFQRSEGWSSQWRSVWPWSGPPSSSHHHHHHLSQVSIVTNMSIPLQADLSSVVEKDVMSKGNIAKLLGRPTVTRESGKWCVTKRGQARKT